MLHRPMRTSGDERRSTAHHRLKDRLHALARAHQVPGAQLAVHTGGTTHAVHTGVLDSITGEPVTADTAVPIGSLTKCYTATVVMLLVADGDVELDDQLGDHVPELRRAAAGGSRRGRCALRVREASKRALASASARPAPRTALRRQV